MRNKQKNICLILFGSVCEPRSLYRKRLSDYFNTDAEKGFLLYKSWCFIPNIKQSYQLFVNLKNYFLGHSFIYVCQYMWVCIYVMMYLQTSFLLTLLTRVNSSVPDDSLLLLVQLSSINGLFNNGCCFQFKLQVYYFLKGW